LGSLTAGQLTHAALQWNSQSQQPLRRGIVIPASIEVATKFQHVPDSEPAIQRHVLCKKPNPWEHKLRVFLR
jgi:hypothetical protein